jgi:hypothetical protein
MTTARRALRGRSITEQTHCNSCGQKLADEELGAEPSGGALVCAACAQAAAKCKRGKWKPVMQWEDGGDGLRPASRAPIPWDSRKVALTRIRRDGGVTMANTLTGKRAMLGAPAGGLILAAWPGQYSQDVFVVDDPKAALDALTPARRS